MNTKRILGLGLLVALSACQGKCSCGTDDSDGGGNYGGGNTGGGSTTSTTVTGTGGEGQTGTGGDGVGGGTGGAIGTGGEGGGIGGAGTGGSGEGGAAPIVDPTLRFLHLSSDAADVNFCLVKAGADAIGPLVEGGLSYLQASAFGSPVAPGNYSVLVVAGDAEDCSDPDAPSFGPFPLGDGESLTFAAIGLVAADDATAFDIARYNEALEFPAAGSSTLRFIHAAPGAPAVDIGEYVEDQFVPYFTGASYPSDAGYSDPQEIPAFLTKTLTARAAGSETDLIDIEVEGGDGAIINAYAILDSEAPLGVGATFVYDYPGD